MFLREHELPSPLGYDAGVGYFRSMIERVFAVRFVGKVQIPGEGVPAG